MIGIIGGYGSIGFEAAKILRNTLKDKIVVAGRNPQNISSNQQIFFEKDKIYKIDLEQSDHINKFMDLCSVVLNCAGTSDEVTQNLIKAAKEKKIHFVDLSMTAQPRDGSEKGRSSIIYSAGSLPGLSALIPRYLAAKYKNSKKLRFYYNAFGRFSETAAKDYLEGLFETGKQTMVRWSRGEQVPVSPNEFMSEFSPYENAKMVPYGDEETNYIAKTLDLEDGIWSMALEGKHTLDVLNSAKVQYKINPEKTIKELKKASVIDSFDYEPHVEMLTELEGEDEINTMIVRYASPEKLTGTVVAAIAHLLYTGQLPHGIYPLGKCPYVETVITQLFKLKEHIEMQILPVRIHDIQSSVQGEI